MFKKALALLMLLALCLCMASCGGSSGDVTEAPTAAPATAPAQPPTEPPTPAPTQPPTPAPTEPVTEDPDKYYIFPHSDTERLTEADINAVDPDMWVYGRNEIFARRGRKFKDAELRRYFESMPWYRGTIEPEDFKESMLSSIEKYNVEKILEMEKRLETTAPAQRSPKAYDPDDPDTNTWDNNGGGSGGNINYCDVCGGTGDCAQCFGSGNCVRCRGTGSLPCNYCYGGKCSVCNGTGEVYKYIGSMHGKYPCDACRGSGNCRQCRGSGQDKCYRCNGSGDCDLCGGSGKCGPCRGTGVR